MALFPSFCTLIESFKSSNSRLRINLLKITLPFKLTDQALVKEAICINWELIQIQKQVIISQNIEILCIANVTGLWSADKIIV